MYTITLTEDQAETLMYATEVLARLGIGEFRDALEWLPTRKEFQEGWHEDMTVIGRILSRHMMDAYAGRRSKRDKRDSHNDDVRTAANISWDLHQVIRHRLAWDRAIAKGVVDGPEAPRKWSMTGAYYDEPIKSSTEPLAEIRRVDSKNP